MVPAVIDLDQTVLSPGVRQIRPHLEAVRVGVVDLGRGRVGAAAPAA